MKRTALFLCLLLTVAISACAPAPRPMPTLAPVVTTPVAGITPLVAATPIAATTVPPAVETPSSTPLPTQPAVDAAQAYFAALQNGDYAAAAGLISRFSLLPDSLTPSDAEAELQTQMGNGVKWSDLKVLGSQALDAKTVLVQVAYQRTGTDAATGKDTTAAVDEQWPLRLENGRWLYNRANLVDYHTLDLPAQTAAGLTIQPTRLLRYTDRLRLVFLAQNGTNEAIVIGQPNLVLAEFAFADQKVEASTTRLVFDRLRSYPEASIEVKGWFPSYPQSVEIHRWREYKEAPWFVFSL